MSISKNRVIVVEDVPFLRVVGILLAGRAGPGVVP
jgi:hypothetical protein